MRNSSYEIGFINKKGKSSILVNNNYQVYIFNKLNNRGVNQVPEYGDLVIGIKNGDPHCLELLFRRLHARLCAYANKFLHDTNDSEEIVQELFYRLWKHRDRLDENKSLYNYLFTSTKNGCL